MKVDIIISADDIKKEKIKDKIVVIIDVLRATSVMITAVNNGCRCVIPVKLVGDAISYAKEDRANCLLGGERNGIKLPQFDLSNSPLEYTNETVKDKRIVMTTTNGTQAINSCEGAARILIGAMINAKAVAEKLVELNQDVVIVNAGTYGEFSMDDFITAGYIIYLLSSRLSTNLELTDISKTSRVIYENNKGIVSFLNEADHYNRLIKLNYVDDLKYCLKKDIINIVPEFKDGIIK